MEILLVILFLILAILGAIRGLNMVPAKALPLKQSWGVVLLCVGVVGLLWQYGFLAGLIPQEPTEPDVFTYNVVGTTTDETLSYDDADRIFTISVIENTTAETCLPDSVAFTLTLTRTDTIGGEDAIAKITSSVPGFLSQVDVNDTKTYYPVTKTGTKFNVEITPSGGSMVRGSTNVLITPAGSKAVDFVVKLSDDIGKLNQYNSKDITINVEGTVFRLKVLLAGYEA